MNIAVVGLGIIGGSYAKAIKKYTDHHVIGINRSEKPLKSALECGAIDETGTAADLAKADMVILCVYPAYAVEFTQKYGEYIKKGAIVTDASGIKTEICPKMVKLSEQFGFTFVGGHPMAGKEKNGFEASDADLFCGASYIIVPCGADNAAVEKVHTLALQLKFGGVRISTPDEHDRMIAFTSQLPHVLACAYVMSPRCINHKGFSAGSYNDVSRVANINAELWSELFLENQTPLSQELDILIENITKIKSAVDSGDKQRLTELLQQGRRIKEALGE